VMADEVAAEYVASAEMHSGSDHAMNQPGGGSAAGPVDFTDPHRALATSPVIQEGKIVRGGMGTGMPYWGPIFTEEQVWALVDYLWTFQFDY
jgi:mono/diheme cytochrome c family protein